MSAPFVHQIRPRYAEVDQQGVVFNAHWLTYFDDSCTRFFESLGYTPNEAFFGEFDVMIVKAVLEWEGPAGFDEFVDIVVEPVRLGTKSFDLRYRASVGGPARVHRRDHLRERHAVDARVERDPRRRAREPGSDAARRRLISPGPGQSLGSGSRRRTIARWRRENQIDAPRPSGSGSQYEKSR